MTLGWPGSAGRGGGLVPRAARAAGTAGILGTAGTAGILGTAGTARVAGTARRVGPGAVGRTRVGGARFGLLRRTGVGLSPPGHRTVVVLVEAVALEGDPDAAEHLVHASTAVGVRAGGEGLVGERLMDLELVLAGLAAVLVGRHGGGVAGCRGAVAPWLVDGASYRRSAPGDPPSVMLVR